MWTVIVGENRLCKTSLLQAIAAAAAGTDRGTQLIGDVAASWPDLRRHSSVEIDASFCFSEAKHSSRMYPGLARRGPQPPHLRSQLKLQRDKRVLAGSSWYAETPGTPGREGTPAEDPLTSARSQGCQGWFVAGYGPSRLLPSPGSAARAPEPAVDRLRPLFGQPLIGTGFVDLFEEDIAREFARILREVFVRGGLLPHITALELRGRGGVRSARDLTEAQRFEMDILDAAAQPIKVPATWLSQGYQSLIAWLADVVGQILLEAGPVQAHEMEGVVLVDEIDVHLHPKWQAMLIPALKRVFPRLQFIATTHSPMVLPSLGAAEVWRLTQDDGGSVVAEQATRSPALLTGTELYQAFFDLAELYPDELGSKLHRYGTLANDEARTDDQEAQRAALERELRDAGIEMDWEPAPRVHR
ncbi:MAG: AAA family ATPase [Nannocystaceae bacterium]|nr:AAA family ATPase [Nannocystaceae bacterium]